MQINIPFTKKSIKIEQRSITVIDRNTSLPISFDNWLNMFRLTNKTPILENIYQTIASEFSKIDIILLRDIYNTLEDGRIEHIYIRQENNPSYDILALRPNMLQSKSELLYVIAYQLHAYGNALVRIVRKENIDRNIVVSLDPLNCEDYEFGQGYEIDGGLYLKLKEKATNKIILLDYADIIHLRLNPNDIFVGDKTSQADLTNFVKVFDENLNVLFNELKNSGTINGVIELGQNLSGGLNDAIIPKQEDKINKQQEIIDRIKATPGGILVMGNGEKFTQLNRSFKTMSNDQIDNLMKYLYNFKGINQSIVDGTANEEQMEVFFNKTIMPIIEKFLEELNYKFLTQTARSQGMEVQYYKNPFEFTSSSKLLDSLYKGGMWFTVNEVRHMAFKLPPIAGGDLLLENLNFTKAIAEVDAIEKEVK